MRRLMVPSIVAALLLLGVSNDLSAQPKTQRVYVHVVDAAGAPVTGTTHRRKPMAWYVYLAHFMGGVFLANAVPHVVNGISGRPFPSPFASPPGQGESSPVVNVVWGAFNTVVAIPVSIASAISRCGADARC